MLGVRIWLAVALAGTSILAVGALTWVRAEGTAPEVADPGVLLVGVAGREVILELADVDSGIRAVSVVLRHASGEQGLVEKTYPGGWLAYGVCGRIKPENWRYIEEEGSDG